MTPKTKLITLGLTTGILALFLCNFTAIARTARIESTTGIVKLKRQNWSEFKPVSANTELNQGDQIFPVQGARVTVLCPDLQKHPVSSGVPSGLKTICPVWEPLKAKNPPPPGSLGGTNALIPYLISPRHTLLLTDTPVLRWNAVAKANKYTVRVMDSQGVVWEKQAPQAQISYPGKPTLKPGVPYSVKIQTDGGQSSEQENTTKIEFIRLHPSEVATIEAEVAKIEQLKLNAQITALTLANFYGTYTLPASANNTYALSPTTIQSYHLTSEAIAVLETTIKQGKISPIIERTLADLYWQIGLANLAAEHYLKALELAKSPEYLEEKNLAQFGLGDSQRADVLMQLIESL